MLSAAVAAACLLASLSGATTPVSVVSAAAVTQTPNAVRLQDGQLMVDGAPYKIKGLAYSPVPVGETVHDERGAQGDYFTPDYAYIWSRDLPAIAAAGFNTLRLYSWNNAVDHSAFLDACAHFGLKLMLTYYVPPVLPAQQMSWDATAQQAVIDDFASSVARLGDHPAILLWSFGNELNGVWNGFKGAFDKQHCGGAWTNKGCENRADAQAKPGTDCFEPTNCVYSRMFAWFDLALASAKKGSTRPMTSTFADVDYLVSGNPASDKIPRFQSLLPNFDVIAIQLYRGASFGAFFNQFAAESSKPLIVGEYGVDAYSDPCGWQENGAVQPCTNYFGQLGAPGGSEDTGASFIGCKSPSGPDDPCLFPGVVTQSKWDVALTKEVLNAKSNIGGFLMSWHDELWKNVDTQDKCGKPCQNAEGAPTLEQCLTPGSKWYQDYAGYPNAAGCTWKAHISCSNYDTQQHDICGQSLLCTSVDITQGRTSSLWFVRLLRLLTSLFLFLLCLSPGYFLLAAPDRYVNEAWFGLNGAEDCGSEFTDIHGGHRLSTLTPRPVLVALASNVFESASADASKPKSCEDMRACYNCVRHYWNAEDRHAAAGVLAGFCDDACGLKFTGSGYVDLNAPDAPKPLTGGEGSSGSSTGSSGDSTTLPTDNGSANTDNKDPPSSDDGGAEAGGGGGSTNAPGAGKGNLSGNSSGATAASWPLRASGLLLAALSIIATRML
jgi:hypothetical protein